MQFSRIKRVEMSEEASDTDDRWSSYKSSARKESDVPWRSKVR